MSRRSFLHASRLARLLERAVAAAAPAPGLMLIVGCSTETSGAVAQSDAAVVGLDASSDPIADLGVEGEGPDAAEAGVGLDASSGVEGEGPDAAEAGDGGFCVDDRPPEMKNYPGCSPPYCVVLEAGLPDSNGEAGIDCTPCGDAGTGPVAYCSSFSLGAATALKCQPVCIGRRPLGLRSEPLLADDEIGTYFATMAWLEGASVCAFARLGAELRTHGAPHALIAAARRARRDEVQHTSVARALARRFGGRYRAPVVDPVRARSLEAIAVENATEGCVRETFGALVATWQAEHAADERVRVAMRGIARDETRHAAFAWRLAAWLEARLGRASRRRVERARRAALTELDRSLTPEPSPDLLRLAGVPRPSDSRALAAQLVAAVRL